jgi:hypothetical protein
MKSHKCSKAEPHPIFEIQLRVYNETEVKHRVIAVYEERQFSEWPQYVNVVLRQVNSCTQAHLDMIKHAFT